MADPFRIHDVAFTPVGPRDRARGLLGYVRCRLGGLRLDGLALRRTADGRRTLTFPVRRDRSGREHAYFSPVDARARVWIEEQIFAALDRGQPEAE